MTNLLDKELIDNILKKLLAKESMTYSIKISHTTKTIYIRLYYNDVEFSMRISDHSTNSKIRTLLIRKNTKVKTIELFLQKGIRSIKQISMNNLFKKLEEKHGC